MKTKLKKTYPEDLKSLLGFTLPVFTSAFSAVIFGLFMQFLTDYSGIDSATGTVGFAARFGTIFMAVSRIIDAVDDPFQAFVMDRAKETKFGKYRKFTILSVILVFVGIVIMFTIPYNVKSNKVLVYIWLFAGYIIYECGTAFFGIVPIMQKATKDARVRTKLMTWYRMFAVIGAVPAMMFVPIATAMNVFFNDMGQAYSVTVMIVVGCSTLISLIGTALLKEPCHADVNNTENEGKVHARDVWELVKTNKPMWVHNIAYTIGQLAYGFSNAMAVYFLKWFYFADMSTGAVDNVGYAAVYGINSLLTLAIAFVCPILAGAITRKIGAVDKATRVLMLLAGCAYALTFICYLLGILHISPFIFVILNFLSLIALNMATIPQLVLNVEVADYSEYKLGKNMTALTTSVNKILEKTSGALSTMIQGVMLIAVGYSVDSVTGTFAGDLSVLPSMNFGFAMFVSLIPAILGIICWAIYKFFYPITPKLRAEMNQKLKEIHNEA